MFKEIDFTNLNYFENIVIPLAALSEREKISLLKQREKQIIGEK